jgi:ATP-dependent RNA helicase DHX37/DHR1
MPKFVPRQRKHKVLARQQAQSQTNPSSHLESRSANGNPNPSDPTDTNAEILDPLSKKRKLRDDLLAQSGTTKVSAKKQKRLDKYIENKLRRDEELRFLKLLEGEKQKVDEVKAKAQANVSTLLTSNNAPNGKKKGKRKFEAFVNEKLEDGSDGESEDSFEEEHRDAFGGDETGTEEEGAIRPVQAVHVQASGLAKPLEIGDDGMPIIQSRKPPKKRPKSRPVETQPQEDDESEWQGFSDEEEEMEDEEESGGVDINDPRVAKLMATIDQVLDSEGAEDFYSGESDEQDQGNSDSNLDDKESDMSDELESGNENEDDEGDAASDTSNTTLEDGKERASAFKAWATQQLNKSLGHTPSYEQPQSQPQVAPTQQVQVGERPKFINPMLTGPLKSSGSTRKAYAVHVNRTEEIQQSRAELPIIQREQEIMEAIYNNPVVIIKGDTGSGKTTQVPQFLYEAGFGAKDGPTPGMVGITQPRRVAAVSMAKRVSDEMGDHGERVSYQIRFDSTTSSKTAVKFMTDGILLRELSEDLLLRKYSVIVIDEAHERSVNTDILIGLLSKIVPARMKKNQFNPNPTPLKLVIMSATLNIGDFVNDRLFSAGQKPPVVEAEGRQHRVTTHFALRSRADYVEEVIEKVRRAHRKLPRGGMLVFLTGQSEIRQVQSRLRKLIGDSNLDEKGPRAQTAAKDVPLEVEDMEIESAKVDGIQDDYDIEIEVNSDDGFDENEFDISDDEEELVATTPATSSKDPYTSVHILPLYSQLPTKDQLRVFDPPPPSARLIVLATNVAETSLTIPGIRYVFDTGRSKERKYNLDSGIQSFEIDYISKASAAQRAGRAGRTGPGHCWRLYTSAVYEQFFPDHAEPEILRAPAESVVLQLKSFAYPKPIVDFPFPVAPEAGTLQRAESLLKNLGALTPEGAITDLGRELSAYPLSPRLGKILSRGLQDPAVLPLVVALIAGLAVPEVFINEASLNPAYEGDEASGDEDVNNKKQEYGRARATLSRHDKTSDAMKLLTAVSMYNAATDKEQFCRDYFLRPKAMHEIASLQRQLTGIIKANHPTSNTAFSETIKLSAKHVKSLNAHGASGYIDQVAIRYDLAPNPPEVPSKPRRAIDVPYLPLIPLAAHHNATLHARAVFIHPSSVLAKQSVKDLPAYITYTHLQKSQAKHVSSTAGTVTKTRMFSLTPIDRPSLVALARDTALLELGKPVPGRQIVEIKGTPKRRECWINVELSAGIGKGFGWPLPPARVREVMDPKGQDRGWKVEEWLD